MFSVHPMRAAFGNIYFDITDWLEVCSSFLPRVSFLIKRIGTSQIDTSIIILILTKTHKQWLLSRGPNIKNLRSPSPAGFFYLVSSVQYKEPLLQMTWIWKGQEKQSGQMGQKPQLIQS